MTWAEIANAIEGWSEAHREAEAMICFTRDIGDTVRYAAGIVDVGSNRIALSDVDLVDRYKDACRSCEGCRGGAECYYLGKILHTEGKP